MAAWRNFIGILVVAGIGLTADASIPLTLTDAIQRALEHNRGVLSAQLTSQASALGIEQAESDFALRLAPAGNVGVGEDVDAFGYGLTAARKLVWGTEVSAGGEMDHVSSDDADDTYAGRLRVRVDQPLFRDAGRLVQTEPVQLANSRFKQSLRLLESTKADLVLQVVETYQNVLRYERLIVMDDETVARLAKLLRLTAARERQGRATRLDTLRVELQLGQANTRLAASREQVAVLRRALADLQGDDPGQEYTLTAAPRLDLTLPPPETVTDTALSNRLDYAQALQNAHDARRGERISRKQLQPDVRVSAQAEQFGFGTETSDATTLDETAWFVGLSTDSDILRTRDRVAAREASVNTSASLLDIEIVRARIVREVEDEISSYRRAVLQSEIAERNLALARSRLYLAGRMFATGRTDNFSVTDAQESLLLAQGNEAASAAEASVAGYRVLRAMGTLIEYPQELKATAL